MCINIGSAIVEQVAKAREPGQRCVRTGTARACPRGGSRERSARALPCNPIIIPEPPIKHDDGATGTGRGPAAAAAAEERRRRRPGGRGMAAVGDAGGDGVDPSSDGDQLRLLGLLVGAEIVAGDLPGGAQLPSHGVGHGQGAGVVVGAGAALHAAPRRAHALRRHGARRLRRPVLVPRRVRRRPLPSGTYVIVIAWRRVQLLFDRSGVRAWLPGSSYASGPRQLSAVYVDRFVSL